ncbi:MAG: hypothetical protein ABL982_05790, partial [Vicinamibacterales bacterium]
YEETERQTGRRDLWVLPTEQGGQPVRVTDTPFNEAAGAFAPDGRHIAYESDESGRQVYVQEFPTVRSKRLISNTAIGALPRWRPDGKELFYDAGGPLMAVDVLDAGPDALKFGTPHQLFVGLLSLPPHNLDLARDGNRFLVLRQEGRGEPNTADAIVVVLNFLSGSAQ